jgi:hypothetical protein
LTHHGCKKCPSDDCVLNKRPDNGRHIILILYVDDLLILSLYADDQHWVRGVLVKEYEKVTFAEGM